MSGEPGVMDIASSASRRALFAALQASQLVIVELLGELGRLDLMPEAELSIRRALRVGAPLGSDEDLAARRRGDQTMNGSVSCALRRPKESQ